MSTVFDPLSLTVSPPTPVPLLHGTFPSQGPAPRAPPRTPTPSQRALLRGPAAPPALRHPHLRTSRSAPFTGITASAVFAPRPRNKNVRVVAKRLGTGSVSGAWGALAPMWPVVNASSTTKLFLQYLGFVVSGFFSFLFGSQGRAPFGATARRPCCYYFFFLLFFF